MRSAAVLAARSSAQRGKCPAEPEMRRGLEALLNSGPVQPLHRCKSCVAPKELGPAALHATGSRPRADTHLAGLQLQHPPAAAAAVHQRQQQQVEVRLLSRPEAQRGGAAGQRQHVQAELQGFRRATGGGWCMPHARRAGTGGVQVLHVEHSSPAPCRPRPPPPAPACRWCLRPPTRAAGATTAPPLAQQAPLQKRGTGAGSAAGEHICPQPQCARGTSPPARSPAGRLEIAAYPRARPPPQHCSGTAAPALPGPPAPPHWRPRPAHPPPACGRGKAAYTQRACWELGCSLQGAGAAGGNLQAQAHAPKPTTTHLADASWPSAPQRSGVAAWKSEMWLRGLSSRYTSLEGGCRVRRVSR